MKKKIVVPLIILTIGLIIYVTNGFITRGSISNNYEDILIINGYKLRYISACNICVGYVDDNTTMYYETYIGPHVYQYCYNDRYIGLKQVKPVLKKEDIDTNNPNYFLIDTRRNTLFEFISLEDYEAYIKNNYIFDLCNWITTKIY